MARITLFVAAVVFAAIASVHLTGATPQVGSQMVTKVLEKLGINPECIAVIRTHLDKAKASPSDLLKRIKSGESMSILTKLMTGPECAEDLKKITGRFMKQQ